MTCSVALTAQNLGKSFLFWVSGADTGRWQPRRAGQRSWSSSGGSSVARRGHRRSPGSLAPGASLAELPGGTCRFAEFFELDTGMITTLRILFDPKRHIELGGH